VYFSIALSNNILQLGHEVLVSDVWEPVSPVRCVLAVIVPALMAHYGLRRKSLSKSGAQSGKSSEALRPKYGHRCNI